MEDMLVAARVKITEHRAQANQSGAPSRTYPVCRPAMDPLALMLDAHGYAKLAVA